MNKAAEVKYLLQFFAQSQEDQWEQIPQSLSLVWVETGPVDAPTDKPLKILVLILYSHFYTCPDEFTDAYDLMEEIRVVFEWMTELGKYDLFDNTNAEEFALNSYNLIWKVVRRLCLLTLDCPSVQQYEGELLSFEYFMQTYCSPISPEEYQQWTKGQ